MYHVLCTMNQIISISGSHSPIGSQNNFKGKLKKKGNFAKKNSLKYSVANYINIFRFNFLLSFNFLTKKQEKFQTYKKMMEWENIKWLDDYNESKYFLKNLVPFLLRIFENLLNVPNEQTIYLIKISILEIFSKVMWENDLIETYQMVLNL